MDILITILIYALILSLIGVAAYWLCVRFKAPDFVFWIVGAILLLLLLRFALGLSGGMQVIHPLPLR